MDENQISCFFFLENKLHVNFKKKKAIILVIIYYIDILYYFYEFLVHEIPQNKDSKNFPSYMPVLLHANFPHHKKVIGYRQVLLASPYIYINKVEAN